jgi:hypothetical protein
MTLFLVFGLALSIGDGHASGRGANIPDPAAVETLIKQLDDSRFSARQDAERRLLDLGIGVVPQLRRELRTRPPLEVCRRLEAIIHALADVHWYHDLDDAKRQAARTGKPILVLSTLGKPDGSGSLASQALLSRTFTDLELVDHLNRNFVAVWHDQASHLGHEMFDFLGERLAPPQFSAAQVAAYAEGRGAEILHSYFCTSGGRVVFGLQGFWDTAAYRAEVDFAQQLVSQTRDVPEDLRGASLHFLLSQRGEALARERQGLGVDVLPAETLERSLLTNHCLDKPVATVVDSLAERIRLNSYG